MALASTDDYENITGTALSGALETRVSALLEMADSSVLAAAHDQAIASTVYEDVTLYPYEGVVYLPQRPVTAVESVAVVAPSGATTSLTEGTDFRWEPGGNGRPAKLIRRRLGRDSWWGAVANPVGWIDGDENELLVSYTAGWDPPPGPIVAIEVAMVKGVIDNAGGAAPSQQAVGPFSASFDGGEARHGTMPITPSDRATIDRFCKVKGPTSVQIARSQL